MKIIRTLFFLFTVRPLVYAMGSPWFQYTGGRPQRWHTHTSYTQATFFYRVSDSRHVLLDNSDILQKKVTADDVHCANMCVAQPRCVYMEMYCKTKKKCASFSCVLKAYISD